MKDERLTCPICSKRGLLRSDGHEVISEGLIVCENEHFLHWKFGGHHFLTRTVINELEEENPTFHVEHFCLN